MERELLHSQQSSSTILESASHQLASALEHNHWERANLPSILLDTYIDKPLAIQDIHPHDAKCDFNQNIGHSSNKQHSKAWKLTSASANL